MKIEKVYKISLYTLISLVTILIIHIVMWPTLNYIQDYQSQLTTSFIWLIFILVCVPIFCFLAFLVVVFFIINYIKLIKLSKYLHTNYSDNKKFKKIYIMSCIPIINLFCWTLIRKEFKDIKGNKEIHLNY